MRHKDEGEYCGKTAVTAACPVQRSLGSKSDGKRYQVPGTKYKNSTIAGGKTPSATAFPEAR